MQAKSNSMKKIVLLVGATICGAYAEASVSTHDPSTPQNDSVVTAASQPRVITLPDIHGFVRARYEWDTSSGYSRFQVRNARVSMSGKAERYAPR